MSAELQSFCRTITDLFVGVCRTAEGVVKLLAVEIGSLRWRRGIRRLSLYYPVSVSNKYWDRVVKLLPQDQIIARSIIHSASNRNRKHQPNHQVRYLPVESHCVMQITDCR